MHNASQKKIIHIDMDCYYAAIEVRDNPQLKGLPVAVGGRSERRGVLTTANYEARKFGVRSAQSTAHALRLCPQLILIPPNIEKYRNVSQQIHTIFRRYTDLIEPLSLDEAYLDVSANKESSGSATQLAKEIRSEIWRETQLTASAGIAPNKFLAKVASDWKKPNGQFTIPPEKVADFVKHLKVTKIPGVGPVTGQKLQEMNLITCEDLQMVSLKELETKFGKFGQRLFSFSRGEDHRTVQTLRERKSLSVENTFPQDLKDLERCLEQLPLLFAQLEKRVMKADVTLRIRGLVLKLKFHDFQHTTIETVHPSLSIDIFKTLLSFAYLRGQRPVRLIGLGVRLSSTQIVIEDSQLTLL